jgi:hypothetical protein
MFYSLRFDYGVGVGVIESFDASAAVCGIPAMIQHLNTSTMSALKNIYLTFTRNWG